jgi:HEAT repeat protein
MKRPVRGMAAIFLLILSTNSLPLQAQQSTESAFKNLKDPNKKIRKEAAADLGVLGKKEAIGPLQEAFHSEMDPDVRGEILLSLGKIRDRAGLKTLTQALVGDVSKEVRLQAIDSILRLYIPIEEQGVVRRFLGGVKSIFAENEQLVVQPYVEVDKEAKEALSKALLDRQSQQVRENAARALGSLKASDQIASMDQALSVSNKETRLAIVKSLGIMRDEKAGPVLIRQLNDRDREVVRQSAISLGLVKYNEGRQELRKLFDSSKEKDLRRAAAEGLALIHHRADKDFFAELLRNDSDDKLREFGAEGLARIADPSTEQALQDRLSNEDKSNVKTAIHFALVSVGKTEHLTPLVQALEARFTNQAEVYLFEIGKHQKKIDLLYPFLNSNEPRIRAGIVRVLGRIGNPDAFEKVKPLAADKNADVAREATETVRILEQTKRE